MLRPMQFIFNRDNNKKSYQVKLLLCDRHDQLEMNDNANIKIVHAHRSENSREHHIDFFIMLSSFFSSSSLFSIFSSLFSLCRSSPFVVLWNITGGKKVRQRSKVHKDQTSLVSHLESYFQQN